MNPFEFVNAINYSKENLITDNITEKAYNSYMINRSLSYFPDTVLAANEMNVNHQLDKKMQFDFLLNIVRKRKRFSKWEKKIDNNNMEIVKEYYGYSDQKALSVLPLLSDEQLKLLKTKIYKGGAKSC